MWVDDRQCSWEINECFIQDLSETVTHLWRRWRCWGVRRSAAAPGVRGWTSWAEPRRRSDWPRPSRTNRRRTSSPASAAAPARSTSTVSTWRTPRRTCFFIVIYFMLLWFWLETLEPAESPPNRDPSSPEKTEAENKNMQTITSRCGYDMRHMTNEFIRFFEKKRGRE